MGWSIATRGNAKRASIVRILRVNAALVVSDQRSDSFPVSPLLYLCLRFVPSQKRTHEIGVGVVGLLPKSHFDQFGGALEHIVGLEGAPLNADHRP